MWLKKTDLEIKKHFDRVARKRKSLVRPMIYGVVAGSFCMLANYLGFGGGTRGFYLFTTPGFSPITAIMGVLGFTTVSAIAYYRQKRGWGLFESEETLLCTGCWDPARSNPENICTCGGALEPYEFYVWQENGSNEPAGASVGVSRA